MLCMKWKVSNDLIKETMAYAILWTLFLHNTDEIPHEILKANPDFESESRVKDTTFTQI